MSHKSQEKNMRKLAGLLTQDLGCIWGEKESGPNGAKKQFLNTGKAFLRALAKDLGLQEVSVSANAAGIGVSGDCTLMGMWHTNGLYVNLSQFCSGGDSVLLYRAIRRDLAEMDYPDLLVLLASLREEGCHDERAA